MVPRQVLREARGDPHVSFREDRTICRAEIHWYEAHRIGKKEFKLKRRTED
jgi:hypothetical protein